MTALQFRAACAKLNVTVYAVADAIGVSKRTAQRYALGEQAIPEPIAKLMRAMIRLGTIDV